MKRLVKIVLAGAVGCFLAAFSFGLVSAEDTRPQVVCLPENQVTNYLIGSLKMTLYGYGINQVNSVELWVQQRTGNWLLVSRTSNGAKCVVTGGVGWVTEALIEH